ncbi:hypothetical protein R6L23_12510 [Streptomyces sp. SR27]|uniref:hypothetical protein n=1 Tax=Streptomyces sp. SR27 TaxID=3076630 RepID=UPI00295BCFCB|nr:hypothetical protein [Streptomyces sp. SR27]MDV9189026.1 hypothetical protein [Streptomyces sp. SR27]
MAWQNSTALSASHLFEGLLKNESEVTVDIVHGDTQGKFNELLANCLIFHRGRPGRPGDRYAVHHQQDPPLRDPAPGHGAARERGNRAAADGRLTTTNRLNQGFGEYPDREHR